MAPTRKQSRAKRSLSKSTKKKVSRRTEAEMAYITPPSSEDEDEMDTPQNTIVETTAVESDTEMVRNDSPAASGNVPADVPAVVQKRAKAPRKPRKAPAKPRKPPGKPRKVRKPIPWDDRAYKGYIKIHKASPALVSRAKRFMMEQEQREKDARAAMAAARASQRPPVDNLSSDDDELMGE